MLVTNTGYEYSVRFAEVLNSTNAPSGRDNRRNSGPRLVDMRFQQDHRNNRHVSGWTELGSQGNSTQLFKETSMVRPGLSKLAMKLLVVAEGGS